MKKVVVLLEIEFVEEVEEKYVYRIWNKIDVFRILEYDDKVEKYDYVVLSEVK